EDAHLLGEFIKDMDNIEKVELLPYHKLGAHKWEALGHDYPLEGTNPPSKEKMDEIVAILSQYHSNVKY
ncbi:pyruvate formate lyase 1-activating protein, partial [Vibrio sp. 10N.222.46.B3]